MSNIFESMLKQYDESHNPVASNAKKYDLKNYFSTYLKDGVNQITKKIRILPPMEGSTVPWVVKWGHKIQVEGSWKTFACLKHEYEDACPFCEAREVLLSSGEASDKELAKKYSARMMYVVKVIDRDFESEGVKFWRFNHDYRKTGIFDKIMGAIKAVQHDISDPQTGRDLNIEIARDQNKRPVVQSISYPLVSTPLNADAGIATDWLSDTRVWQDVYSVRDYNYLAIVVSGEVPVWSKAKEKFVAKSSLDVPNTGGDKSHDDLDSELVMGGPKVNPTDNTAKGVVQVSTPAVDLAKVNTVKPKPSQIEEDDEDDDLPF